MIETCRFTLDNGLRVIHNFDGATAMVAVNVLYDVGSRDESPSLTGIAHLNEHLMFEGSVNVTNFDAQLEKAGGKSNAWTSCDFTNFYDIIPAQNAETAFWLESDRMMARRVSQHGFEVQQSVVIEEFKQQCLNLPYGNLQHHLRRLVYRVHPYSHPVIGIEPSHISRATLDDLNRFYDDHFSPANAVLAVTGNISADRVGQLARKWFEPIPTRHVAPRLYMPEPPVETPRFAEASGRVPATEIHIAYPMDGYGTRQYFAADLLTDLLANGPSSRFYRRLLMGTDLFTAVDASIYGSEEPGMLSLSCRLSREGADMERRAVDAIHSAVADIVSNPPTTRELTRAVNRMESAQTFGNISYLAKAQALAIAEIHGEDINSLIPLYRSLTPDEIAGCASTIIDPQRSCTLIYRPDLS